MSARDSSACRQVTRLRRCGLRRDLQANLGCALATLQLQPLRTGWRDHARTRDPYLVAVRVVNVRDEDDGFDGGRQPVPDRCLRRVAEVEDAGARVELELLGVPATVWG